MIKKIWTKEIDVIEWLKSFSDWIPTKIESPTFECQISPSSVYSTGLQIDNIIWQEDYKEYYFEFQNTSNDVELIDVRLNIEMPGGFVDYKINSQKGCEDITFSQDKYAMGKTSINTNQIEELIKFYISILDINIIKIFPQGNFTTKFIIKYPTTIEKDNISVHAGWIKIEYRYLDKDNQTRKDSFVYDIIMQDKEKKWLFIDTENPIEGERQCKFMIIPDKILIFKPDGSIKQGMLDENGNVIEE
jgi:hypothetical protein